MTTDKSHTFQDSLDEVREVSEARERHELRQKQISDALAGISLLFPTQELIRWKHIEYIIGIASEKTGIPIEDLRNAIKGRIES